MSKAIYMNGRIYEGVTPSSFGRADYWNTESEAEHNAAEEAYLNHIESFPSYPCPSPHPFIDGQEVVKGEDYELQHQLMHHDGVKPNWHDCLESTYECFANLKRIIATPIDK